MKVLLFTAVILSGLFFNTNNTLNLATVTTTKSISNENTGEKIFKKECASCHTGGFKGFMSGAPDIDDVEDWAKSLEKGLTVMTKNIFEGTKRHEEKGGCEDCSKEEIKAAIEYILSEINE